MAVAGAEQTLRQLAQWHIEGLRDVPGAIAELSGYLVELLAEHARASATWPKDSINDRLDAAFAALAKRGILAMHHAGETMGDGWTQAAELADTLTPPARGATFYHGQDLERAIEGQGLHLAFGSMKDNETDDDRIAIGREVVAMLEKHRVPVQWSGSAMSRIEVLPFAWHRRRHDDLGAVTADEIASHIYVSPTTPVLPAACGCGDSAQITDDIDEMTGEVLRRHCARCGTDVA